MINDTELDNLFKQYREIQPKTNLLSELEQKLEAAELLNKLRDNELKTNNRRAFIIFIVGMFMGILLSIVFVSLPIPQILEQYIKSEILLSILPYIPDILLSISIIVLLFSLANIVELFDTPNRLTKGSKIIGE